MGVAASKNGAAGGGSKAPHFADDFYGTNHQRLSRSLRRQFASGVKYNSSVSGGSRRGGPPLTWDLWGESEDCD